MISSDFKVRYQGSVLGYAWSLLRPLFLFAVLYVVFVYIIPLGKDVEHFPVYLLTGVILWNFFAEATTQGSLAIVSRGELIRKISIPRYLLVISSSVSALINLGLSLVVLVMFAIINGVTPGFQWLLVFPLIIEIFIFTLGISFLLSTLYVKFRDISYIWEVFLQVGFYASAIIFPLSSVPVKYHAFLFLNPIVQIIQDARYLLATQSSVTIWSAIHSFTIFIPFAIIALVVAIGGLYFKRRSKYFAEDI